MGYFRKQLTDSNFVVGPEYDWMITMTFLRILCNGLQTVLSPLFVLGLSQSYRKAVAQCLSCFKGEPGTKIAKYYASSLSALALLTTLLIVGYSLIAYPSC